MTSATHHNQSFIFADGHVHIYRNFAENLCLVHALENFHKAKRSLGIPSPIDCVLFLAETPDHDWFNQQLYFALQQKDTGLGRFRRHTTEEKMSLVFSDGDSDRLTVIAGRQIVSAERLEVLALGHNGTYPDGLPLMTVLSDINTNGALAVLPWGVGKWMGARRRIINSLIKEATSPTFFLADSANRPFFWPLPNFFTGPLLQHSTNPAGSDPLPLRHQEKRIGSRGFLLPGPLDPLRPFAMLRAQLLTTRTPVPTFGRQVGFFDFFSHQTALRLRR